MRQLSRHLNRKSISVGRPDEILNSMIVVCRLFERAVSALVAMATRNGSEVRAAVGALPNFSQTLFP
jgi:hypothetical protein